MGHTESKPVSYLGYFVIFFVLCIMAIVNISVSFTQLDGTTRFAINMGVAAFQAFLLSYFFMHLKEADKLTWLIVASGFFWVAIMFILMLTDYYTRPWGAH